MLIFALALTSFTVSFAKETSKAANTTEDSKVTKEMMVQSLIERGYPTVYLEHTSYSVIKSIYEKPHLEFEGAVITTYDEESGAFIDYNVPASGITRGKIPTADLSLTWAAMKNNSAGTEHLVFYSYEWNNLPFFRWQDPIAVSWDGSIFQMKDNSFYQVDYYDGFNNSTMTNIIGAIKSEEYGYANGGPNGVSWYADLVGHLGVTATRLYGHGEFVLKEKTSSTGTTVFYGHYVHPKASFTISIGIPGYASFNITGGSNYDDRGNQMTYDY